MSDDPDLLRIPHLDLPVAELETLADRMDSRPAAAEQKAIVKTVREQANWPGHLAVSPHRVAATLQLEGVSVSAEQVAWVMLQGADR